MIRRRKADRCRRIVLDRGRPVGLCMPGRIGRPSPPATEKPSCNSFVSATLPSIASSRPKGSASRRNSCCRTAISRPSADYRDWLEPHFFDPGSGRFIQSVHCYVVRSPRHTVLIDTCVGNDKQRPSTRAWNGLDTDFLDRLRDIGVTPADVDYVLCTHLHVDHVGWNTRLLDGRWVPTFPNARYLFHQTEFDLLGERTATMLLKVRVRATVSTRTACCQWSPPDRPSSWPTATPI